MRRAARAFLDLLYPPACPACDTDIDGHAALCAACEISLYPLGTACRVCGEPIAGPTPITCRRCVQEPPPFDSITAPFRYGGQLAIALQRLKYQRRPDIARTLAPLLAPALLDACTDSDVIVPIPLHWRRRSTRGFNQATLLVEEAQWNSDIPIDTLSLCRTQPTAPQTGINARDRAANVAGAFAVGARRATRLAGKNVLLFDDVITTGATVAEAARAVLGAGAATVRGLCLARAET